MNTYKVRDDQDEVWTVSAGGIYEEQGEDGNVGLVFYSEGPNSYPIGRFCRVKMWCLVRQGAQNTQPASEPGGPLTSIPSVNRATSEVVQSTEACLQVPR